MSSNVKIHRYTHSQTSMNAALEVPGGSSGDSHAIVVQLARIVSRMSGSKTGDSTTLIARLRGKSPTWSTKSDVLPYSRPDGPRMRSAGGSEVRPSRPGSLSPVIV